MLFVRVGRAAGVLTGWDDTKAFVTGDVFGEVDCGWLSGLLEVDFMTPFPCWARADAVKLKVNKTRHSARYAIFLKIIKFFNSCF